MKAPAALPLQTLKPKMVFERLRASGASELTMVWFATMVARRPQSRSTAPRASAAGRGSGGPPDAEGDHAVGGEDQRDAGDDDGSRPAQVEHASRGARDQDAG